MVMLPYGGTARSIRPGPIGATVVVSAAAAERTTPLVIGRAVRNRSRSTGLALITVVSAVGCSSTWGRVDNRIEICGTINLDEPAHQARRPIAAALPVGSCGRSSPGTASSSRPYSVRTAWGFISEAD